MVNKSGVIICSVALIIVTKDLFALLANESGLKWQLFAIPYFFFSTLRIQSGKRWRKLRHTEHCYWRNLFLLWIPFSAFLSNESTVNELGQQIEHQARRPSKIKYGFVLKKEMPCITVSTEKVVDNFVQKWLTQIGFFFLQNICYFISDE